MDSSERVPPIYLLPDELLFEIAGFVKNPEVLSVVDKRLKSIAFEWQRTINQQILKEFPRLSATDDINPIRLFKKNIHKIYLESVYWGVQSQEHSPTHFDSKLMYVQALINEVTMQKIKQKEISFIFFVREVAQSAGIDLSRFFINGEMSLSYKRWQEIWEYVKRQPQFNEITSVKLFGSCYYLPEEIAEIVNLNKLVIEFNKKIRELPDSILIKLRKLETLEISHCPLLEIPQLAVLASLNEFVLDQGKEAKNKIEPGAIWNNVLKCGGLKALKLLNSDISEIPDEISRLSHLRGLILSGNKLITLPESLTCLKELVYLDLTDNPLIELPKGFGKLENLLYLLLRGTQLRSLPNEFAQLKNLRNLSLGDHFQDFPECIEKLFQLRRLAIGLPSAKIPKFFLDRVDQASLKDNREKKPSSNPSSCIIS